MTEIFHYPSDLEALVAAQWPPGVPRDPLADSRRALLEVAYHASMMREEGRPVRVRIALAHADELCEGASLLHGGDGATARDGEGHGAAHEGPLVLRLDHTRPFDVDELRRIAIAAPFETALVAVEPDAHGELRIWGIVSTGAQWLAPTWGGRARGGTSGSARTIVHVRGPARIAVHAGDTFVAGLEGGRLVTLRTDVFSSRWMPALFAAVREELVLQHAGAHGAAVPALDESLVRTISQHMVRRALWLMREAHHGGTILFVEPDDADALLRTILRPKYRLTGGHARTRYRALLRALTDTIAARRRAPGEGARPSIDARDFAERADDLADTEAAIFELSRTIASLSAVDGAVVLSKRFELLAFGTEIAGARTDGERFRVRRALDGEGEETVDDDEENVGTRHRAAYRFVLAHPRGLAIVVSQDGTVRFVACREGSVTYYEQHLA